WSVTLDGQAYNPGSSTTGPSLVFTPAARGVYAVTLSVTDAVGGSGSGQTSFLVSSSTPAATIIARVAGQEGVPINVSSVVGDPTLALPLVYDWTVQKNGNTFTASAPGNTDNTFVFTPDDEGNYQVSLTITDANGHVGSANPVTIVVDDTLPTA